MSTDLLSPPGHRAPTVRRDPRRGGGRAATAAVVVAVLVVTAAVVALLVELGRLQRDADASRLAVAGQDARQDDLEQQLADLGRRGQRQDKRVGVLEARLAAESGDSAVVKRASRSVFTIRTDVGSGSGFVVGNRSGRAQVVTNFHVVADGYLRGDRTVTVQQEGRSRDGRVVEVSEGDDLAVIEVDRRLPSLRVANHRPAVGDPLLVLGSPLGLGGTVTSGIASAYREEWGVSYLQFSAPISPGNSGGPVLDRKGRVVGVSVAKMIGGGAEGLGFAIPSGRLCVALSVC